MNRNSRTAAGDPPVLGFCAYSGTGKTTLLVNLLPLLRRMGFKVGVIKHSHHHFEIDHPGKDSFRLRKAGATEMMIASGRRWALMVDLEEDEQSGRDPDLGEMLQRMDRSILDLIIVEGFKHESIPKIELHRSGLGKPLIFPADPDVIAVATDAPGEIDARLPLLDLNDPQTIADFVVEFIAAGGEMKRR